MRTVALDLGVRKVCFCEIDDGAVVRRVTARSLEDLDPLLGEGTAPAASHSRPAARRGHVHDVLRARGHQPILIDTTRVLRIGVGQHRAKTDRRDAEALARALERGDIPVAHVLSPARRHLRDELCTRGAMVETRARYVTTLRGIARAHGVMLPSCSPRPSSSGRAAPGLRRSCSGSSSRCSASWRRSRRASWRSSLGWRLWRAARPRSPCSPPSPAWA